MKAWLWCLGQQKLQTCIFAKSVRIRIFWFRGPYISIFLAVRWHFEHEEDHWKQFQASGGYYVIHIKHIRLLFDGHWLLKANSRQISCFYWVPRVSQYGHLFSLVQRQRRLGTIYLSYKEPTPPSRTVWLGHYSWNGKKKHPTCCDS